jgi:hypothetical protein
MSSVFQLPAKRPGEKRIVRFRDDADNVSDSDNATNRKLARDRNAELLFDHFDGYVSPILAGVDQERPTVCSRPCPKAGERIGLSSLMLYHVMIQIATRFGTFGGHANRALSRFPACGRCRQRCGWNLAWRGLRSQVGIVSGCEVNWLIDELCGERLPAIDFAHVDPA